MKVRLKPLLMATAILLCADSSLGAAADIPPLAATTEDGFSVPQPGTVLSFPATHGSHPDFRIEWWYITGHLFAENDRRFGFQATFFRSAVAAPEQDSEPAAFGTSQIFLAHMSMLDERSGRFIHEERLNRNGWDAAAAAGRLDLANGNWSLSMTDEPAERMKLVGSIRADALFSLTLAPEKPRVIFGEAGVSRKGADPTAASYYITFPRLSAKGSLRFGERDFQVSGQAWMDHEISSSQLSEGQAGWDWCSLQFDDDWELMAYRLRRDDGSTDPFSTLAWISPQGKVTHLAADEFAWEPVETWTSPETGGVYPVRYRIRTKSADRSREVVLEIRPLAAAQELAGSVGGIAYWEGACDVFDDRSRKIGVGFTELTGYAESLFGRF